MAIAYDAGSQGETTGLTLTVSHTCASSPDVVIFPACEVWSSVGVAATTCTYDSTSCTEVDVVTYGASTSQRISLFELVAPSSGANDIVFTIDSSQEIVAASTSYTGVDQTTPTDTPSNTVEASATSISQTITSETGDLVIDVASVYNGADWGADGSQTERVVNDNGAAQDSIGQSSKAGAASVDMEWTVSAARPMGHIGVNVNAAADDGRVPVGYGRCGPSSFSATTQQTDISRLS